MMINQDDANKMIKSMFMKDECSNNDLTMLLDSGTNEILNSVVARMIDINRGSLSLVNSNFDQNKAISKYNTNILAAIKELANIYNTEITENDVENWLDNMERE